MSHERKYFATELASEYGAAYASVLCAFAGLECRQSRPDSKGVAQRLLNAKLAGYRHSAVLILKANEYNEIETDEQAEALVKRHRAEFREAFDKDTADRDNGI